MLLDYSDFPRRPRKDRRRGAALVLYTVLLPTLLLIVGLAIDLSMLYVVQTRLSAAVDGAALGAGRLLGTPANTSEIAGEFLNANYPAGFWGSYNLVPNITVTTNASLHTIVVNATVQVSLIFLRLLRQQFCTVAASATAVRRDVRVVLVLDRSYSMNSQMSNLRTAATSFVNMFNPGTDELGLVVFGGSALVAYPTVRPYSLTTGTGPDIHYADTPSPGGDNMLTMISALQVGTDTNTSEALWMAYNELKKAVAIDTDPTRANVIVLFTDGVPNGFTAYLNDPSHNVLGSNSNCYYNPASPTDPSSQMIGWIATAGNSSTLSYFNPNKSQASGIGVYSPLIFDTTHTAKYWVKTVGSSGYVDDMTPNELSGQPVMKNCQHIGTNGNLGAGTDMSGLAKIPPQDYYGNSTTDPAYTQSALYGLYGIAYDSTKPTNGYHMGLASWSAADNVAQTILKDTAMNIAIYTIGFTGNGGVDNVLLKRMANTQDSSSYNANYQSGTFVTASDIGSLQQAFGQVASEVLRLTK